MILNKHLFLIIFNSVTTLLISDCFYMISDLGQIATKSDVEEHVKVAQISV